MERTMRSVEVTLEASEVVIRQRRRRKVVIEWCTRCGRKTGMLDPDDAAALVRISKRRIYQHIEAGSVHFIESSEGDLIVCLESLKKESL